MTVINYYKPQDLPLNLTKTWVPEAPRRCDRDHRHRGPHHGL